MNLTSLNQTARAFLGEKDAPPVMKDDPLQNVNVLNQWPRVKKSSLDASQMQALQNLLTKKVAIVQGPPGTGKTFVSVSALRIMLQNWNLGDPPIIISAQTNHALDQLLMLIEPFETNFIRLGGRTSEENGSIRARTIFEVRMRAPPGACPKDFARISARKDLSALENTLKSILVKANGQNAQELETFRGLELITMDQYESLHDNEWVSEEESGDLANRVRIWLGREYRSSPPSCPPKVHFDEEEEPIEYEALGEDDLEAEKLKEDDDADILNGNFFGIRREYVGFSSVASSEKRIVKLLSSNANLWDIDPKYRGHIYNFLKREAAKAITKEFTGVFKDYMAKTLEIRQCRWKSDATMIKRIGVKLIGCTTTGLSKYRALLASLEPRILLIEEAAETLEGNVLAGMFETLEQLILVGDHKQLQANCNVEQFAKPPYNLAVSLFERLIENGLKYVMLKKQRRMISELRWLLNLEYPELGDHDSVLDRVVNRPSVPGMGGCDSYFMHHDWPESNSDTTSRSNSVEAEMIARFFNYLVLNKVDASKITVLTFYNGQRKLISRYLKDLPNLASNSFKVYTIDSYQGEENDVILLSLVRSNAAGNIGFLEKKNRSVVALSRARRGLYIFGNAHTLIHKNTESTEIWKDAIIKLRKAGNFNFDSGLPIICSNHGTKTICMDPDDLASSSGGCSAPCGGQLPCGHRCTYTCHP
jgi:helicase required for RNAi-mediated heterochromatin assembly 1